MRELETFIGIYAFKGFQDIASGPIVGLGGCTPCNHGRVAHSSKAHLMFCTDIRILHYPQPHCNQSALSSAVSSPLTLFRFVQIMPNCDFLSNRRSDTDAVLQLAIIIPTTSESLELLKVPVCDHYCADGK